MTDKLLCPFCQQELEKDYDWVYGCPNRKCKAFGYFFGAKELWQALIDTKKKLDRAIWWLNEIVENHRFTPISTAEKALAELTKGRKDE